jgi:hypothetical protein
MAVFSGNEIMTPMGITSTHFISYREINVQNLDIIEDAWGLNAQFVDVIALLRQAKACPVEGLTEKLIDKIRKHH